MTTIFDILGGLGSGALSATLKGLDNMDDVGAKALLAQTLRKVVTQPWLKRERQQRIVGLLRDAAAEVYIKDGLQ